MRRAVVAVALAVATAAPASADVTLQELRDRAEEARRLAEAGVTAPSEAGMDTVRSALGLPDVVTVQGRRVSVPADPVLAGLRGTTADDFRDAVRQLDAMAVRLETAPAVDRAELRADLQAAYGERSAAEPGLQQRIRDLIESTLAWLGRGARGAFRGIPGLIALGVLGAVAMVLLMRRGALRLVPEGGATAARASRSSADWRRLASEARARGDLAEAIACLYRALVAELAAHGLIDDHPSLTARDVRLATAAHPRLAGPTAEASRRYEAVRYGGVPPSGDDLASLERADRAARTR